VLIDECHLVSPKDETMYKQYLSALRTVNPHLKVVGLTATAWRLGHGRITEGGGLFTDVCCDMTSMDGFNWLLAEGYLCPLVPKATTAKLDVDGVHMRNGEFALDELQAAVDKHEVSYAACLEAVQLAGDRAHWLVFCSGVDHSDHVAAMLTSLGISAVSVHSKMGSEARDAAIRDFKSGRVRAVVNNNILTTGFDFPGIDCIVVLRPTASTVLWVQLLGRGTRPVYAPGYNLHTKEGRLEAQRAGPKANCLVLDFAGNTKRLGPINDPVIPRKRGDKPGDAPVRICTSCSTYNHASARHCVYCGAEFTFSGPKVHSQASTDDLIRVNDPVVKVLEIDHVTYTKHTRIGKPPMVRVTYYCGLSAFSDFIGFEHPDSFSQRRARQWWRERVPGPEQQWLPIPTTTADALALLEHLKIPTHLRVWTNKKPYPQVMAACFDGSAFDTQPPSDTRPEARVESLPAATLRSAKDYSDLDDDIPF
jgi:DNA repair protein RadD